MFTQTHHQHHPPHRARVTMGRLAVRCIVLGFFALGLVGCAASRLPGAQMIRDNDKGVICSDVEVALSKTDAMIDAAKLRTQGAGLAGDGTKVAGIPGGGMLQGVVDGIGAFDPLSAVGSVFSMVSNLSRVVEDRARDELSDAHQHRYRHYALRRAHCGVRSAANSTRLLGSIE